MAGAAQKIGSASAGLRLLTVVAALAPVPASAGAWVAPEGGQSIWTSIIGEREGLSFFESSGLWEAPVAPQTAAVVTTFAEQSYVAPDGWRAEATVGVKQTLFRDEHTAVALQVGALWSSDPYDYDCREVGSEVRLLAGRSFGRAFANVEAATRAQNDGCQGERLDLTLGYRPGENWLTMAQVFVDAPDDGEETVKAQLTLVYFRRNGQGIQVGVRTRVDGGPPEAALVVGLWGRAVD